MTAPAPAPTDQDIADAIEALLEMRRADASICPSEAARRLAAQAWRPLMPAVRRVALDMARAGRLRITQGSATVPLAPGCDGASGESGQFAVRGAIRLRRP